MPASLYLLFRRLRSPLISLVIIYAVSITGFVLIPGQDDQGNPWQMSFFHAFYFVSYMASTIGFGEIPYAFTDAQRAWAMVTIYATVIGWLYSIGSVLSVLQDKALKRLRREASLRRKVEHLHAPFYLICGYGDTGKILVKAMADEGVQTVVVDADESNILELELNEFVQAPYALIGDVSKAHVLENAGISNALCKGVVALTNDDHINLQIALTAHLLNPKARMIARVEERQAAENITSFGMNEVINPFDVFAERLALALQSPSQYILHEWMTGIPHEDLQEPLYPEKGRWIICGYGRFGQALYSRLCNSGVEARIIEENINAIDTPIDTVAGSATVAETLIKAGTKGAAGIVAATDDDADNLSIILTARELNKDIFTVGRENWQDNHRLFKRAEVDITMQRGSVLAHKIFAILRTPLISEFLELAKKQSDEWANITISRLLGVTDDEVPHLWEISLTPKGAPASYKVLRKIKKVQIKDLRKEPFQRTEYMMAIPLLIKRNNELMLMPDRNDYVQAGDRILMCATYNVRKRMDWTLFDTHTAEYVLMNQDYDLSLIGWLKERRIRKQQLKTR